MNAIVYSPQLTPRVDYSFCTLLKAVGFSTVEITDNKSIYHTSKGIQFNYSNHSIVDKETQIKPHGLLFQNDIKKQEETFAQLFAPISPLSQTQIISGEWVGVKCNGDIFSAAFYLLTRYEEYLPHTKDLYGRYAHENCIAFRQGFLQQPIINIWLADFKQTLLQKYPLLLLNEPAFKLTPTYDIDIAWSYQHKGFARNAGGFLKDIFKGNRPAANERIQVLLGKKEDPFDSYEWLHKIHKQHGLKPIYFFLLAQKNKGYDKNILPSEKALQLLIKQHADQYDIGIHPSWQSGDRNKLVKEEIEMLSKISGRNIHESRQHYIRMSLPGTYQKLLQAGITDDYSMGYGSINGFRASYCLPYPWYDLEQEQTTQLTIHPFCFMDANSFYEQRFTPQQAMEEMQHYYQIVKKVNGELITIWHNHFLGTEKMFTGWKEVYEAAISDF